MYSNIMILISIRKFDLTLKIFLYVRSVCSVLLLVVKVRPPKLDLIKIKAFLYGS